MLKLVREVGTTLILFVLSVIFMPIGIVLSVYKSKKYQDVNSMTRENIKKGIIINLVVMAILSAISFNFTLLYLGYVVIEYFYATTKDKFVRHTYDKIFVGAMISLIFYGASYYFLFRHSGLSFEEIMNSSKKMLTAYGSNITQKEIEDSYTIFKNNILYIIFIFAFAQNYFIYRTADKTIIRKSNFYIYWIILYSVGFVVRYISKDVEIDNYMKNLMDIIQFVYLLFGLVYGHRVFRLARKTIFFPLIAVLFIYFPILGFLYGARVSYKDEREELEKEEAEFEIEQAERMKMKIAVLNELSKRIDEQRLREKEDKELKKQLNRDRKEEERTREARKEKEEAEDQKEKEEKEKREESNKEDNK